MGIYWLWVWIFHNSIPSFFEASCSSFPFSVFFRYHLNFFFILYMHKILQPKLLKKYLHSVRVSCENYEYVLYMNVGEILVEFVPAKDAIWSSAFEAHPISVWYACHPFNLALRFLWVQLFQRLHSEYNLASGKGTYKFVSSVRRWAAILVTLSLDLSALRLQINLVPNIYHPRSRQNLPRPFADRVLAFDTVLTLKWISICFSHFPILHISRQEHETLNLQLKDHTLRRYESWQANIQICNAQTSPGPCWATYVTAQHQKPEQLCSILVKMANAQPSNFVA